LNSYDKAKKCKHNDRSTTSMKDNQDHDMTATNIRLSRIRYPRANLWATTLLVVVFMGFGLWAQAAGL